MPLTPPATLSPSKVTSFTDCALAFRFSAIDQLPEAPSEPATRGTLVHAALERLFALPAAERTPGAADACLAAASEAIRSDPEFTGLGLTAEAEGEFFAMAHTLLHRYFELEDPTTIRPIGIELKLAVPLGNVTLRGIIDRLELDDDGGLVVTDYKTGKAPNERHEQGRLTGVQFYSYLCEQLFGQRPAKVQLLYLGNPLAIVATPTEQSTRALRTKLTAVWTAVERACATDNFKPRPGPLCNWCSFKEFCPAFGGDPEAARSSATASQLSLATP